MAQAPKEKQAAIVRRQRTMAQARGDQGETLAAEFLQRQGLKLVARNVRCRGGEIDLICCERSTLVFVEVRARTAQQFGSAAESITPAKQRRIALAAQWWLNQAGRSFQHYEMRFDAVLLDGPPPARLTWLRNAFTPEAW